MKKKYMFELGIIFLVFILSVAMTEFILPKPQTPYARIMKAELRRDYPLFQQMKDSSPNKIEFMKSVYSKETLYALDILMDNQMNLKKSQVALSLYLEEIEGLTLEDKADISGKLMEFQRYYGPEVRFISTAFLLVAVIVIWAVIQQFIYFFHRNKAKKLE